MTPVKLTESERLAIRGDEAVKNMYVGKIIDQSAYILGVTSGDVTWAQSRHWAAEVKANPSLLLNDPNLMVGFEFNMLGRDFDNKDTDTEGSLADQVIAYLNDSTRWAYLVDDYFASKGTNFLM